MNLLYNINTEQGDKMRDLRILIISLSWLYTKELTFRRYDFYKFSGVYFK